MPIGGPVVTHVTPRNTDVFGYASQDVLNPLEYQGNPGERAALRPRISSGKHDVVIMSYDSLRADIDILALHTPSWCYCILDEGHAIRNPKSRVTQAVKKIRAEHRLLLSGTPIQNDVVELWSLFDFLMPGFLGTEREFKTVYGVAASRSAAAKKGGGLTEQGALATGKLQLDRRHRCAARRRVVGPGKEFNAARPEQRQRHRGSDGAAAGGRRRRGAIGAANMHDARDARWALG